MERAPGLAHGGHGLIVKVEGQYNVFRNCETKYTNIELAYPGVQNNLAENIRMIGQGTSGSYWHTNIDFRNGANNNTVRNIYMTDVWSAVNFSDDHESIASCGYENRIENLVVENADRIFQFIGYTNIGGSRAAPANSNIFDGGTFVNYTTLGAIYNANDGNQMVNCTFRNGINGIATNGYSNNISFNNNTYENVSHTQYGN